MESLYLKNYLDNVGNAIHALNTICVGLSAVSEGKAIKPDDMIISWKPKDVVLSSKLSRIFAIKSAYVFLAESMHGYIDQIKSGINADEIAMESFHALSKAEKIDKIVRTYCASEDQYRLVLLKLLIHTRNRIVHKKSKADISSNETDCLKQSSQTISDNHSGLIIDELVIHFREQKFTLKDVSTHAANSIYMVRRLDECFASRISTKDQILGMIAENDLIDEWNTINRQEEGKIKTRKIENFIKNYFAFLESDRIKKIAAEFE